MKFRLREAHKRAAGLAIALFGVGRLSPTYPAHAAGVSRVFVSTTGSDAGDCSVQTTPCRNLAAAMVQVDADGEVIVLSPGEYETAPLLINKSIRITSPTGTVAFVRQPITVNIPAGRVVLRGLTIKGTGTSTGINLVAAASLSIEHTTLDFWNRGLDVASAAAARVSIADSTFLANQTGVRGAGTALNRVSISESRFERNTTGVDASLSQFTVRHSLFTANTTAGISVSGGPVEISHSQFWTNGVAVLASTGGTARIDRSHVVGNTIGLRTTGLGSLTPLGTNVIRRNGTNIRTAAAPTVTTGSASSVLKTTATLSGTVNDNDDATAATFDYGLTNAYGTNVAATPSTVAAGAGTTAVTRNATGLTCGSTYHFRAKGVNVLGTTFGSDQTFNTLSCAADPPTATTTAATGIGLTAATLNGTINDNLLSTTVTFEYGPTVSYGTTTAATPGTVGAGAGNTAVSLSLTGLTCGTTYHFRVKGVNLLGATSGSDLSFATDTCLGLTAHPRLWLSEPATIARLTAAANANSAEWVRLKNFCDTNTLVSLGSEYQGLEAFRFIANFSLCYRIMLVKSGGGVGPAAPYAQKAINVLTDPQNAGTGNGTGKQNVLSFTGYCTDSGFGIRAYVPAMAIAYDWLFDSPLMTASIKSQIITRINGWLNWYDTGGFVPPYCTAALGHDDEPGYANETFASISNYNAGFTTSSVLAAIAISGEDASAPAMMTEAVNRFDAAHTLFDQKMPGGHWPEGWNYGPLVYQSHLMAAHALKTFTGTSSYLNGKLWLSNNVPFKLQAMTPDGQFFYDDGLWSGSGYGDVRYNDIAAAGLAFGWNSANGALAKLYIDKTLAADPSNLVDEQWKGFLLYDPTATPANVASLPRSHLAQGLGLAVMRSDWSSGQATWASAALAGPYLSYQGEQDKDEGHITLYKGGPLLIDAGQDLYTDAATHNTFLHNSITMDGRTDGTVAQGGVDYPPAPFEGTQTAFSQECTTPPGGASTPIGNNAFVDASEYLFTSGEFSGAYQTNPLNFPDPCGRVPVNWMNRSVFYLRPDVFVVYDQIRKRTTGPGGSQANITPTQHWHFPTGATTLSSNRKVSVDNGGGRLHFQTVFPTTTTSTMVNEARNASNYPGVANSHLSVRQSGGNPVYQNFLTVMRAGLANASYVFPTVTAVSGTNAFGSFISGLLPAESATPIVVVFADNGLLTFPTSITYQYISAVTTRNFVAKLKPNQIYSITPNVVGSTVTMTIAESASGTSTNASGVLVFNQ